LESITTGIAACVTHSPAFHRRQHFASFPRQLRARREFRHLPRRPPSNRQTRRRSPDKRAEMDIIKRMRRGLRGPSFLASTMGVNVRSTRNKDTNHDNAEYPKTRPTLFPVFRKRSSDRSAEPPMRASSCRPAPAIGTAHCTRSRLPTRMPIFARYRNQTRSTTTRRLASPLERELSQIQSEGKMAASHCAPNRCRSWE
jgi:hypothetical protein